MTSDKLRLEPPPATLPPGSTVWAYLRDSGGPTQERSVQQQREMILEYCKKYGLVIIHAPFEDIHKSGKSAEKRDQLQMLMSLSATDERPQGLLIWNHARFTRSGPYDAQLYKSTLRSRGIVIHSLTDKIPEGSFAPIIEAIVDEANKQKREEAAFGSWRGLHHNLKQGAVSGFPPVGIKRKPIKIKNTEGIERTAHRWDPDPSYKFRINKAFKMKAQRKTAWEIHKAVKLYNSINSYVDFFSNPIYIGTLRFGDEVIENYCAPTIPKKLWAQVQAIVQENKKRRHLNSKTQHPRRTNSLYILSGLLKCARCGAMMNGQSVPQPYGEDYRSYICAASKTKRTCKLKPVPAKVVEKMVLDNLDKFFDDPQNLINVLTAFKMKQDSQQKNVGKELISLNGQLAQVRKKLTHSTKVLVVRPHSPSILKQHDDLESEEADILNQINQLRTIVPVPIQVPSLEKAQQAIDKIKADLNTKNPATIRETLLSIVSEITVERQQKNIIGRFIYFHTPSLKKKITAKPSTMSINHTPVGAPTYRHSIFFRGKISNQGRPKKKPPQ